MCKILWSIFACIAVSCAHPSYAQTFYSDRPAHLLDAVDAFTGAMPTAVAQSTTFPARGVEIVNRLYAGVNPQDDVARREHIKLVCEQMAFELGARWGGKKRTGLPDTFRSPDSIAFLETDNTVSVWDIQLSSGAIDVYPGKPANHPNLSPDEAAFMPCEPKDHIGGVIVVPPDPPAPPPPIDISPILSKLDELMRRDELILADVQGVRQSLEEHRAEARKTRSRVLDFLGNWRTWVGAAVGVGGFIFGNGMDGAQ